MVTAIPTTASEWIIRLDAGSFSESENKALAQWISENPDRVRELEEAAFVWHLARLTVAGPGGNARLSQAMEDANRFRSMQFRRRTVLTGIVAVAASLGVLIFAPPHHFGSDPPQLANGTNVQTGIGQVERYGLPDTSLVTMAPDSAVAVSFTESTRVITLNRGEVFLSVESDRQRPFTVTAGTHSVTVIGTEFNVDYDAASDELEVAVTEGSVDVGRESGGKIRSVKAGDVIFFKTSTDEGLRRGITPEQAGAWREGALHFDETSVRDALRQMNRYAPKPIVAADDRILHLTLTGTFEARNTASFIYALEAIFGLNVRESANNWELSFPS